MRRGDSRFQGGGTLNQPISFYNVVETNPGGALTRTPTPAWSAFAQIGPYLGQELRAGAREIGETWSVFQIRYHRSRVPIDGMQVVLKLTGEVYEVRGVEHIDFGRKMVECTCRLVR